MTEDNSEDEPDDEKHPELEAQSAIDERPEFEGQAALKWTVSPTESDGSSSGETDSEDE